MKVPLLIYTVKLILIAIPSSYAAYEPTWDSLDSRPLPSWYDEAKVGIFVHWGVYSVPGFQGYDDHHDHYAAFFWSAWHYGSADHVDFMKKNYPPNFTYQNFGPQFKAEFYDPQKWAEIFQKAGAKYVVLTSKHHEGYSLYPSKYTFGWNSMDVGPKRDLVGDLAVAIREKTDLKFGLYYSLYEWFHPLYMKDKQNEFNTDEFVQHKILPELYEIVNTYEPEIVWSDGQWEASSGYWQAKEFLAWLYNESPVNLTVVTNDRWGSDTKCEHGGFMTCGDYYNPGVLQPKKWEHCMTLDKFAFGHRRNAKIEDYLKPEELIKDLVETVSCGGNLLVNVGPTAEGMIIPIQEELLLQLGSWLDLNGQAIYQSVPWTVQNDTYTPGVWYTSNPSRQQVYAIILNWPGSKIYLADVEPETVASVGIFGSETPLMWISADPSPGIIVNFPRPDENQSKWAWTVVIDEK